MSSQSSYRNGRQPHSFYSSHLSTSPTDPAQIYGSTRNMGPPPPLDLPRPLEIDLNSSNLNGSRTLPSPSASAPASWDSALFQNHSFGDVTFPSTTVPRQQQISGEGHARGDQPNPLLQWYSENDGPWIPRDIMPPDERLNLRHSGNRNAMPYGGQQRQQNQTEGGHFHFGVPGSDSGYGTRQSVANTSVFSGDVNEREDCQSVLGPATEYQPPYHGYNEILQIQNRDLRTREPWATPTSSTSPPSTSTLVCSTCHKHVKTPSELKKHDFRHRKPFRCLVPGCKRADGFSTTNDLERHTKSKHPSAIPESASAKRFRCLVPGCKSKDKSWPRLDNFRSHLKRVHQQTVRGDEEVEKMIKRGEYWERSSMDMDQDFFSKLAPQVISRPPNLSVAESETRQKISHWKPPLAEVAKPSQDLDVHGGSALKGSGHRSSSQPERSPLPYVQHQGTVEPLEIFPSHGQNQHARMPLEAVLLTSAGSTDTVTKEITDQATPQTTNQGEAARRHNEVSASDATITEVVKTVLAAANIPETPNDRPLRQGGERIELPNSRISPHISCPATLNPAGSAVNLVVQALSNGKGSPSSREDISDSQAEKKALTLEILNAIRNLGFIVQKDPNHSPKVLNAGSIAGNKSENQVICDKCRNFKGRPCELKKHMKRHSRPYGCTFLTCNKTFGSKNDWKRHENSQHFHLETWRCNGDRPEGGKCAKVCYRRQTFQEHLKNHHQMSDDDTVKAKLETCRIGRNCQARFWCGFCNHLIDLKKKGLDAWTERFDHIDDHFMGRHGMPKQGMKDWIPVDSDKPKGEVESPHSLDASPGKEVPDGSNHSGSGSPDGSSPESRGPPPDETAPDLGHGGSAKKRKRSHDGGERRPAKQPKAISKHSVRICCQCKFPHNPKLEQSCTTCENGHQFCKDCKYEDIVQETSPVEDS